MDINNNFSKGLNLDLSSENQPESTYRFALNLVNNSNKGDSYILVNEKGTNPVTNLPDNLYVIGKVVLEDNIIIFLVDSQNTISEIGIIDKSLTYTMYIHTDNISTTTYDSTSMNYTTNTGFINELNFNIQYQIDTESRIAFNNHRIIYFTDNLNRPRFIDLDDISNPLSDTMDLQLAETTPIITLNKINDTGGSVTVGSKQFVARQISDSNNESKFGFISEIIPIIDEPSTTTRQLFDGRDIDYPTTKSIEITINNLSTKFKFVEVIVLYYSGASETLNIKSFAKVPINSSSIIVTYTGEEATEDLILDDINEELVIYTRVKALTQKNAHLIMSNVSTAPIQNYQDIFNNIKVCYTVQEHLFPETITNDDNGIITVTNLGDSLDGSSLSGDYKNPRLTFERKGYMRDEIYSLAGMFLYKDGTTSPAFHIPGNDSTSTPANTGTQRTGTYLSQELYPITGNYIDPGGPIRHHRMPSLYQEPHYRWDGINNYIRILGINFTNIDLSPHPELANIVDSIVFLAESRDKANSKSIRAQGVSQRLIYFRGGTGHNVPFFPYKTVSPLFENFLLQPGQGSRIEYRHDNTEVWATIDDQVGFYSPDTLLGGINIRPGDTYSPVLEIFGTERSLFIRWDQNYATPSDLDGFYHTFCNFYNIVQNSPPPSSLPILAASSTGPRQNYGNFGTINISTLYNLANEGYIALELNGSMPLPTYYDPLYHHLKLDADTDGNNNNTWIGGLPTSTDRMSIHRWLTNITTLQLKQYGTLDDAQYKIIGTTTLDTIKIPSNKICFNGDTFITKFAYKNCGKIPYQFDPESNNTWHQMDAVHAEDGGNNALNFGFETRCVGYFFVESPINTEYRHRFQDITTGQNGIDYFPHNLIVSDYNDTLNRVAGTGILDQSVSVQDNNGTAGYNKLYSKENDEHLYIGIPEDFEEVNDFPNRTVYSEQSIEGEIVDSYRNFRPNSIHDIPKNTGPIWDNFVFNNKLYLHTTGSLWRSFFEEVTSQSSTSGEVFLGTGTEFSLPSQQIYTSEGGYAGTQSQWAGLLTPFGYVYPDMSQGKIFILADEGLQELSMDGMWKYFSSQTKILTSDPSNPNYTDNPANPLGTGLLIGYDYGSKLIYVVKKGINSIKQSELDIYNNSVDQFNISYSPILKQWVSFHSYIPSIFISKGDSLYSMYNDPNNIIRKMYKNTDGNYGMYYQSPIINDSIIVLVSNKGPLTNKVFDNLIIYTTSLEESTNNFKINDTFNNINCYNNTYNTSIIPLVIDTNIYIRENKFRTVVPRSVVIDSGINIFDSNNLDVSLQFKPRVRGNHMITKLIYNNNNNYKFCIHEVTTIVRPSYI